MLHATTIRQAARGSNPARRIWGPAVPPGGDLDALTARRSAHCAAPRITADSQHMTAPARSRGTNAVPDDHRTTRRQRHHGHPEPDQSSATREAAGTATRPVIWAAMTTGNSEP